MKTLLIAVLVSTILAVGTGAPSVAAHSTETSLEAAEGACPAPFQLHPAPDHDHDANHPHQHVGTDTDKNGDGWICVKRVGNGDKIHVHTDNNLPL